MYELVNCFLFNWRFQYCKGWFNDCVAALIVGTTTELGKHFMYFTIKLYQRRRIDGLHCAMILPTSQSITCDTGKQSVVMPQTQQG